MVKLLQCFLDGYKPTKLAFTIYLLLHLFQYVPFLGTLPTEFKDSTGWRIACKFVLELGSVGLINSYVVQAGFDKPA